MHAPRHRRFATGLVVHGEVQHFAAANSFSNPEISSIARAPKFKVQDVRMRSKK